MRCLDRSLPPFNEVALTCFRELVYQELNVKVNDTVISLVEECLQQEIDRASLYLHPSSVPKLLEVAFAIRIDPSCSWR
ncbi:hypothetical protein COLO4_13895 [Corchorus olitorius]|uniref:Uncharacterized protein n=1 Tax=Corchorus olitorius TaxID=93759 RepID=A0A1R3JUC5_9ROSI|nr:hypothetical protein COLO4_13895 [Corchorus olitorius]